MKHEFCPDCGHLLSRAPTPCTFCGWSDRIDDLAYRGFDPDRESDLVYMLADEAYTGPELQV